MPIGPLGYAGAALGGAGLIGSLLNKPHYDTPDISGELANISALFSRLRDATNNSINTQAAQGRGLAASNLAARGTYRAPVAENTFNALERDRLNTIGQADAQIGAQEADARSRLMSSLLGYNFQNQQLRNQANASTFGSLTGMGSNLLLASLMRGSPMGPFGTVGTGMGNTAAFGPSANFF